MAQDIAGRLAKLREQTGDPEPTPAPVEVERERWREDEHRPLGETGSVIVTQAPEHREYVERAHTPWVDFPSQMR